jgi:hypothetical protein
MQVAIGSLTIVALSPGGRTSRAYGSDKMSYLRLFRYPPSLSYEIIEAVYATTLPRGQMIRFIAARDVAHLQNNSVQHRTERSPLADDISVHLIRARSTKFSDLDRYFSDVGGLFCKPIAQA